MLGLEAIFLFEREGICHPGRGMRNEVHHQTFHFLQLFSMPDDVGCASTAANHDFEGEVSVEGTTLKISEREVEQIKSQVSSNGPATILGVPCVDVFFGWMHMQRSFLVLYSAMTHPL